MPRFVTCFFPLPEVSRGAEARNLFFRSPRMSWGAEAGYLFPALFDVSMKNGEYDGLLALLDIPRHGMKRLALLSFLAALLWRCRATSIVPTSEIFFVFFVERGSPFVDFESRVQSRGHGRL